MSLQDPSSSALGSESWLGVDEYETGCPLHTRAGQFLATVKWDVLAGIASKRRDGIPCRYEEKFSIGHFNMVRRINFDDGVSYVVRLRLPDDDVFADPEALTGPRTMEIEIATMKFLRSKTCIPVPEVLDYSTATNNPVGAPYMLMEYIHGSVATELRAARSCPLQMFGTPEQDRRFRKQMAQIQANVATFRFPQIGSLYHNPETDEFYIGPDLQTGKGPWTSSSEYYDDLTDHLLKSASTNDELSKTPSFMLPLILNRLMSALGEEKAGPFRLTNRDFGAHNILVDDNFDIVGVIDFDGVMAAPLEVVAQYPVLSFLETEPPGFVPTKPAMIERIRRTAPKLREYKELLAAAELGQQGSTVVADRLGSRSAGVYKGMAAYAQHQGFVNERWMEACLAMVVDHAKGRELCHDE